MKVEKRVKSRLIICETADEESAEYYVKDVFETVIVEKKSKVKSILKSKSTWISFFVVALSISSILITSNKSLIAFNSSLITINIIVWVNLHFSSDDILKL
jgi:hypothetical protein